MRDLFLRALVGFAVAAVLITEILSAIGQLHRGALLIAWVAVAAVSAFCFRHVRRPQPHAALSLVGAGIGVAIGFIVLLIGITAALSPPNTFDALAYHLPRIVYWAQARSVEFFPTSYLNQISLPPAAEYIMLHTYLAVGSDHLVNLISTVAFAGCIIGVSAVTGAMGAGNRAQLFAALVCATLPGAILQASGPKNDILLALWLVSAVYFVLRGDAMFAGLSIGLAIATKSTAYIFILPLIAVHIRRPRLVRLAFSIIAGVLLLNAPQYWRNFEFSGSILGFDSPFGDETFKYRNQQVGWKPAVSNILRHTSEQLGGTEHWNQHVYDSVLRAHTWLVLIPMIPAQRGNGAVTLHHKARGTSRTRTTAGICCCLAPHCCTHVGEPLRLANSLGYLTARASSRRLFCFASISVGSHTRLAYWSRCSLSPRLSPDF